MWGNPIGTGDSKHKVLVMQSILVSLMLAWTSCSKYKEWLMIRDITELMLRQCNNLNCFYRNKLLASDLTRRHTRTDIGTRWSKSIAIPPWFLLVCCWTYIHHRNVYHSGNLGTDNLPFGQYHPWECCRMWARQWCAAVGCFDGVTKHSGQRR